MAASGAEQVHEGGIEIRLGHQIDPALVDNVVGPGVAFHEDGAAGFGRLQGDVQQGVQGTGRVGGCRGHVLFAPVFVQRFGAWSGPGCGSRPRVSKPRSSMKPAAPWPEITRGGWPFHFSIHFNCTYSAPP